MTVDGGTELIERAGELAGLAKALADAAAGTGRLVVVEGPAGVGKSQLLAAAVRDGRSAGFRVLTARASDFERDFPFGVVVQLLGGPVAEGGGPEALTGAAALAAPLFAFEQPAVPPDGHAILHGLHWLVADLAEDVPVLLAVDDAHWADEPSLRFLLYLAQRVEDLPVAVVVATRPSESGAALTDRLRDHDTASVLAPGPLSRTGVAELVHRAVGDGADDELCRTCFELTQGNPFLVRELLASLPDDGTAGPGGALVAGAARTVVARLARLPAPDVDVARAVAVLGRGGSVATLAALSGVDVAACAAALERLTTADVIRWDEELSFVHPLVEAAVYEDMGPAGRIAAHRRAAALLVEVGAPVEQIAAQLHACPPAGDASAVAVLRRAAAQAATRGAPEPAVHHLRRALEEPPPPADREAVLLELARAEAAVGDEQSVEHLRVLVDDAPDGQDRVRRLFRFGSGLVQFGRNAEAVDVFDRALALLDGDDPALELRIRSAYVAAARLDLGTRQRVFEQLPEPDDVLPGETPTERSMLAHLAYERGITGVGRDETVRLARAALATGDDEPASERARGVTLFTAVYALTFAEELDLAAEVLDRAVDEAGHEGSVHAFAHASHFRGYVLLRSGRLADAAADAAAALDAHRYGWRSFLPGASATLALARLAMGDPEGAAHALELPPQSGDPWDVGPTFNDHLDASGRVRLASGDAAGALADFLECGRRQDLMGAPNPASLPWRVGAARACAALGRADEARAWAEEAVARARVWGAPRTFANTLVALAAVVPASAEAALAEALAVLDGVDAPASQAAVLHQIGVTAMDAGERLAAREPLRRALHLATGSGHEQLAAEIRAALVAAGGRPRRVALHGPASLTPSERRVASMAAAGRTNRDIAEALFVSTKAVEWHLGNAYRKLGITARSQLADVLAS